MEVQQQFTNTVATTKKKLDKWLSDESTKLLHRKMFDRPYKFQLHQYIINGAMSHILCAGLDCDFNISDDLLEKITLYVEKRR